MYGHFEINIALIIIKVYVELKKGLFPVLNANVIAKVLKPNGDVVNVTLKDNGIGKFVSSNEC